MFTIATLKLSMCMLLANTVSHFLILFILNETPFGPAAVTEVETPAVRPAMVHISIVKLIAFVRCAGILNIMQMVLSMFISYVQ